jgi:hypothetical protein
MLQIARNLCDVEDAVLRAATKLLIDRDTKYSHDWRAWRLARKRRCGGHSLASQVAESERLRRAVRALDQRRVPRSHVLHWRGVAAARDRRVHLLYHEERNHQGLGNRLISAAHASVPTDRPVQRRMWLASMLSFYQRAGA